MPTSDSQRCPSCRTYGVAGSLSWSGDPIFWNTGERERPTQQRAEELVFGPASRLAHPEIPAHRCPSCRLVWLTY